MITKSTIILVSFIWCVGSVWSKACPTAAFAKQPPIPARSPGAVAIHDLNSDRIPDVIASMVAFDGISFAPQLGIFLGKGDGSFRPPTYQKAGHNPWSIGFGDFNKDGRPDLAVANLGEISGMFGDVAILLGHGDGTFDAPVHYAAGNHPYSVAVADLNLDGAADLALANNYSPGEMSVSVYLGRDDGSFQPGRYYSAGGALPDSASIAIGDFNSDGKPDLAVANTGRSADDRSITLLHGDGSGGFRSVTNDVRVVDGHRVVVVPLEGTQQFYRLERFP